jgi:FlaA1/EpsC-like NDP-sugar epimerase
MKKSELIFNTLSLPLDAGMLLLAAYTAYESRYYFTSWVGPVRYDLALHNFILTALAVTPVLLFIFACFGLYNIRGARKMSVQGFKVFASVSLGLFLVMILFFFDQQLFPSRFIILAAWGYAIAFVFVGRALEQLVQQKKPTCSITVRRVMKTSLKIWRNVPVAEQLQLQLYQQVKHTPR